MIEYSVYKNNNKKEFLLKNYDFYDGNDYIAKLICDSYDAKIILKEEYIWHRIIQLSWENKIIELKWHEDIGNSICILNSSNESEKRLEEILVKIIEELNKTLK